MSMDIGDAMEGVVGPLAGARAAAGARAESVAAALEAAAAGDSDFPGLHRIPLSGAAAAAPARRWQ